MVEKDVQKRILRAILHNGGEAKTREIMGDTGLNIGSVSGGTRHLLSRALISRKMERTIARQHYPPHKIATWILNERKIQKIKRLISEIEE